MNDSFCQTERSQKEIMPDLLHPKQKGYAIWAEAIEPSLRTLLAEDS